MSSFQTSSQKQLKQTQALGPYADFNTSKGNSTNRLTGDQKTLLNAG
jgi:hypothetical protein